MKKILITTIISIVIVGLSTSFLTPTVTANAAVMIQQYYLSPEILMPGDTAILTLEVRNGETVATQTTTTVSGGETTTIVRSLGVLLDDIRIDPAQSGGKQIRATTHYEDIGYLAAGASIEVNFKLNVDANISEGIYFPIANIDVNGGNDVLYPLLMKVSNATLDLLQTNVPSKISKGGATDIIITAVNKRDNAVNEIIIIPHSDDIEFLPSQYFLGSLPAKTSQAVVFSIKPLETGSRDITFDVRYKNGENLHTNSLTIPITIIPTLDVAPIVTNFPISITKGGSSRISIEVYNAKTEKITGVLVTPISNATVIPSQYFIGSMDPDDVFSASFEIYADTLGYGTSSIGFIVSFKQGNEYYETPLVSKSFNIVSGPGISYQASGSSSSQSSGNGLPQPPSLTMCLVQIIIVIVVIIIVAIFFIRWRRRRKMI